MSTSSARTREPRLARWEIVGAWLHIWTPPKGFDIPPVPWRAIWAWSAVGLAVIGIAAVIAVPRIDDAKKQGAAERARASAKASAAERARLRADQRVHLASVAPGTDLVRQLEAAITEDAKSRVQAKTITGPVLSTTCAPTSAGVSSYPDSRVYKCFVKTKTGIPGEGGEVLHSGYPFVATIYATKRQLAWCKQNPHADEKGTHGDVRVRTSPVCAGKLTQVL